MQAIETRSLCGARIKATTASGISRIVPYDHEFSCEEAHWQAAKVLAESLGWLGRWQAYSAKSVRRGFVFVNVDTNGTYYKTAERESA